MEKTIVSKVTRFIELSNKFSKSWKDLYPDDKTSGLLKFNSNQYLTVDSGSYANISSISNTFMVSGNFVINGKEIYIDEQGNVKAKDAKTEWTRADEIRAEAEIKAKLADEFDEFNKLKNELAEYFTALKKITE
jgi:hypothetical protein